MPKRTASFNDWRLSKLADSDTALHYLNAASSDSPQMFRKAIKNVIQARFHMTYAAKEAGITREALYKALSESGNPTDGTLRSVLGVLGYGLGVVKLEPAGVTAGPVQPPVHARIATKQSVRATDWHRAIASPANALQLRLPFRDAEPATLMTMVASRFFNSNVHSGIRPELAEYRQQDNREELWKKALPKQQDSAIERLMTLLPAMQTTRSLSQASTT